jgi:hypothetical protein
MKQQKSSAKASFSSQEVLLAPASSSDSTDGDFTGNGMILVLSRIHS